MREDDEKPFGENGANPPSGGSDGDDFGKKARLVVRLVAGGFLLVGFLNLTAYWVECEHNHTSLNLWRCVYLSIPLVIGVIILIRTSALAQRIEDWLEQ